MSTPVCTAFIVYFVYFVSTVSTVSTVYTAFIAFFTFFPLTIETISSAQRKTPKENSKRKRHDVALMIDSFHGRRLKK